MKKCRNIFIALLFALSSLLVIPIHAEPNYVSDDYGLLSVDEISELEELAASYSDEYDCGIYVRVKEDYELSYYDVEDYSEYLYKTEDMGIGEDKNGVMLLIVMSDRSYDIVAYGDKANTAFTDYAKNQIANDFLSDLSNGYYESAFETFIESSAYMLKENENGTPVDVPHSNPQNHSNYSPSYEDDMMDTDYISIFVVPPVIALIVVIIMASKHKTKGRKFEAGNYIKKEGTHLMRPRDIFLYERTTRTRIRTNDDHHSSHGGGTSVNSGGFSHSSGHF